MIAIALDDAEFHSDLERALDELEHDVDRVAHEAAEQGVQAEQADHPYEDQTYELSGGAHVEELSGGDELERGVAMTWPAKHASFVQQGTKEKRVELADQLGEERAKNVELLGDDEFGGAATKTASGQPGGNKPYPFLKTAMKRAENVLEAGLDEALEKFEKSQG